MNRAFVGALFGLLALAGPRGSALADTPAVDFSGSWKLDRALSQSMDAVFALQDVSWLLRKAAATFDLEAEITQAPDRLVVRFDNLLGQHEQDLWFDGRPHETVNPAGMPTTFTTRWVGGGTALVATGVMRDDEGRTGLLTEHRTLSADGAVMTVEVTVTAPDGRTASARRAYRRQ